MITRNSVNGRVVRAPHDRKDAAPRPTPLMPPRRQRRRTT